MIASLHPGKRQDITRARALVDADRRGTAALAEHLGEGLLPGDRAAFYAAAYAAAMNRLENLLSVVDELLSTAGRQVLAAEGTGPLLDPACAAGNCAACPGAPCEHSCHHPAGAS